MRNCSFHSVFKRLLLQTRKDQGLFEKGLGSNGHFSTNSSKLGLRKKSYQQHYGALIHEYTINISLCSPCLQMLLLQGNNYGGGTGSNTNAYGTGSSSSAHMYEDDLISRGARGFSLGHGMLPAPQAYSFGFPVHPSHDPMGFSSCEY